MKMSKSKEQFMRVREREANLDYMHFDTIARFEEQERERFAIMCNILFK